MIWTALTLLAFTLGLVLQIRFRFPWLNPTLIATVLVAGLLLLSGVPYERYVTDVRPVTFLLEPAVVALAVPLYRLRALLARQWRALLLGGLSGTLGAVVVDHVLPRAMSLGEDATRAIGTAPATSPVVLQLAQFTHAPPALAATMAVLSGLLGALLLPAWLNVLGIRNALARGIAMGSVSHGIGTARAREESEQSGAASSVGMGLAALTVTLVVAFLR